MTLFKKLVLALFVSIAMIATAPSVLAAGKVKNQTHAETVQALDDTVASAEETLAAIKSGADKETVMALYKKTKQTAKTVESSVVLATRDKGLARVKKSSVAYKKGNTEDAIKWMTEGVKVLTKAKDKFHNF